MMPFSVKDVAIKAKDYARQVILEGTTQLTFNRYASSKKQALRLKLSQLRAQFFAYSIELSDIDYFYRVVEECKKESLGNCYELALMALDYVARQAAPISAEVYSLGGGDHAFLVIGRSKQSDPHQPNAWGDSVYICDPWADDVYLASQYLEKTKNYYWDKFTQMNCVESYHPKKHYFCPKPHLNTDFIRTYNSDRHLKQVQERFISQYNQLLSFLSQLERALIKIIKRLERLYGLDDEKFKMINEKITQTQAIIGELKAHTEVQRSKASNYYEFKKVLEEILIQTKNNYKSKMGITKKEETILLTYHNNGWRTRLLQFFQIAPTSYTDTRRAFDEAGCKVQALPSLFER